MFQKKAAAVAAEVRRAVVGKDPLIYRILTVLLARGHILLEDMPGVGKTTLALAFSRALGLDYKRVQFTPDLMPSDITGFSVYNRATGQMEYREGAAVCSLLLADEINRAPSRTQSALLEAMEERSVTVDGVCHPLPEVFFVIATQNPFGSSGTQALPDSQLDRFMARFSMGYPEPADEIELLRRKHAQFDSLESVRQAASVQDVLAMQRAVDEVFMQEELYQYIVRLVGATREHPQIEQGASPRASLSVMKLSQAAAWMAGRDYVLPEDIRSVFRCCVSHRVFLSARQKREAGDTESLLTEILKKTAAPRFTKGGSPC